MTVPDFNARLRAAVAKCEDDGAHAVAMALKTAWLQSLATGWQPDQGTVALVNQFAPAAPAKE